MRSSEELRKNYWLLGEDSDIGPIQDFVVDEQVWEVGYIVVDTGWWHASKLAFLPPRFVDRISVERTAVSTHLGRAAISGAPHFQATSSLEDFEHELAAYWRKTDDDVEGFRER